MSFLTVFIPSLVLTAVIGAFLPLTWRAVRTPWAFAAFWGIALFVHLAWLAVPRLGAFAPLARWLAIMWLGSMLSALMLLIPFASLNAFLRRRKLETMSARLPTIYVSCFLLAGLTLSFTSTAGFVVREESVRIAGLPADLDGFRIANLGDVHIGRFIDAKELGRGIKTINDQKVDLLVVTGDLVDDASQIESSMQVLEQRSRQRGNDSGAVSSPGLFPIRRCARRPIDARQPYAWCTTKAVRPPSDRRVPLSARTVSARGLLSRCLSRFWPLASPAICSSAGDRDCYAPQRTKAVETEPFRP